MKLFRKHSAALLLGLFVAALVLRAELAPYIQNIDVGNRLESVFFKLGARRPPSETRPELSKLIGTTPTDADLYSLRGMEAERQLDPTAAESDWRKYADLASDKFAGQIALADFYHRRLEPAKELAALQSAASLPASAAERFTPATEQRSWSAFQRALTLIDEQLLGYPAAQTVLRAWIDRYQNEPTAYRRAIDYSVAQKQFADADDSLKRYTAKFPNEPTYPVEAQASIEAARGSNDAALAAYDRNFRPLWPPQLVKSYFELMKQTGSLRRYLERARQQAASDPNRIEPAARIFYYWQQQGNLEAAVRAVVEYETRHDGQWTADQLWTLAQLYASANNPDRAARAYYAMYSAPGASAGDTERALGGIAKLLLTSAGQGIRFGSGDVSYYRDVAQADPYPGYLNGIVSLLFNSTSPSWKYSSQNDAAQPYFHRARAAELIALYDQRFPNGDDRAMLHVLLILAYATHGDDDSVTRAGTQFISQFPDHEGATEVAVAMADAYARTNQTQREFAIYDATLQRLASKAEGVPLGEKAGVPPRVANPRQPQQAEQQQEEPQPQQANNARPRSPEYARILDRYIARLVSLKRIPDALALYRRELGRNPNDPGLYERFAAFLEQNRLGVDVEDTYKRAMAQFPDKTWSHKLARWYLRQKQTTKLDQLTAQVAKTFSGTELQSYFSQAVPRASLAPVLYRQLNLYAHQRFPHNLSFTRNLLAAYTARGTADPVAYEALLRANWFYADDLRARFFELLSRTKRLDAELAALGRIENAQQVATNPAAASMLAEGEAWRTHYENAAPVFRAITAAYPVNDANTQRTAAVYRSLATLDPKQTDVAVSIEQNLIAYAPRDTAALTYAGEIWADRERFDRARPLWNRIQAAAPGMPDSYLESATVFWDYFLYDDALRVIDEGRKRLGRPALHAYQAGAIYENKRQYDRALNEYAAAVVNDSNDTAARRMVRLARRPALRDQVERLTVDLASAAQPNTRALDLRSQILENQGRRADWEQMLMAAANRSNAIDTVQWIENRGRVAGFEKVQERALQRRVEITSDPVDKVRYQLSLAHFYEEQNRTADAANVIAAAYKSQPNSLGVIRATTDFYWRAKQNGKAVDTLTDAASRAQPAYKRAFQLEAARKATESGDVARARQVLGVLIAEDPYRAEYLSAMADTYARAGDDRGLRAFYTNTIDALRKSNLPAAEKTDRIAAMRRGVIPVLTKVQEYSAALDQYIEIVNAFPDDADVTREAAAYAGAHNLADRLAGYYTKTVADAPKDYRWPMVLARVDQELERFPEALDAYAKAVTLRPERADLWQAQGELQQRILRFADAERTYTRMYELSYRNPMYMERVAELRARQGQRDQAISAIRAAYIENRPERYEDYFSVATRLSGWGYMDAARQYAEKGADIAGEQLAADTSAAVAYASVMGRARQFDAAYKRLAANGTEPDKAPALGPALQTLGSAVRNYYAPEEKTAFAAFLEKLRKPGSRTELEAAQAAGLEDVNVRILIALLRATPTDLGLMQQLQDAQQRRVRFGELGSGLEAIWKVTPPDTENRDNLLVRAADAFHQAGDTVGELRIIGLKKRSGLPPELAQRFCRLVGQQPAALATVTPADAPDIRELAANCAIQGNRPKETLAAIALRGAGQPPVWTNAYNSLAGLYFGLNTPDIQNAWTAALGSMVIGDRIGKPVDRDQQIAGDTWFYFGARYGEYLAAVARQPGAAADFIPAMIELYPQSPYHYLKLGDYYRENSDSRRALARYSDALELDRNRADAHDRMAEALWGAGRRDEAAAEFKTALEAYQAWQDKGAAPPEFWTGLQSTLTHIGAHDLLAGLKADADRLLRTYVRRNGNYMFDPLLEGMLAAARDPQRGIDWLVEVSQAAQDPVAILTTAVHNERVPAAQRDALFAKLIAMHEATVASSFGGPRENADGSLRAWQIDWARSLVERGLMDRARALLGSIPDSARDARLDQIVPLELQIAARSNGVPALLAKYGSAKTATSPEILRNAATELRARGQDAAARRVLEFVYSRELQAHRFEAPNFLGLAEVRLEEGDTAAAVALLRRMNMLAAGEPFSALPDAAKLLDRFGKTAEAAEFYEARVKSTPWDDESRARLAELRKDTAALTALVNDKSALYVARAGAAAAMRRLGGAAMTSGSGELDLLASSAPLGEAAVNKAYWYRARVEAAAGSKDPAVRIRLLQAALATEPQHNDARLSLFRAALEARRYNTAIASVASLPGQMAMSMPDSGPVPNYILDQFVNGAGFGIAERAAVARGLGESYQRLGDPTLAQYFWRLSLAFAPGQAGHEAIEKNIAAARAAVQLRTENDARRPVVTANVEQPHAVRPRVGSGGGQ